MQDLTTNPQEQHGAAGAVVASSSNPSTTQTVTPGHHKAQGGLSEQEAQHKDGGTESKGQEAAATNRNPGLEDQGGEKKPPYHKMWAFGN